jgi:hypothetical protein
LLTFVALYHKWSHLNRIHMSAPIMADSETLLNPGLSGGVQPPVGAPEATAVAPYDVVAEINRVVDMGAAVAKGNAKVSGAAERDA